MSALRNLRIAPRLYLAFGLILLIVAASAAVGVWRLQSLTATARTLGTTDNEKSFIGTAFVLENTGVHAYLGQAGRLQSKALLGAAASIVTVEARHAAAIAVLNGDDPFGPGKGSITPDSAFDTPRTKKQILAAVGKTGFIKG